LAFLHCSDAQIRDPDIIPRSKLVNFDKALVHSLRLEWIEQVNDILLAATLSGFRHEAAEHGLLNTEGPLFAVHTGDLIDISLSTELLDAAAAIRVGWREGEANDAPFFSVPGNHDGLTFGTIDDRYSKTWELGINRIEFDLGLQYLFWGQTVAGNEALERIVEGEVASIPGAPGFSIRVNELKNWSPSAEQQKTISTVPLALKNRVNLSNSEQKLLLADHGIEGGTASLQTGYFSQSRNGFRLIFLDTRSRRLHLGDIGLIQLGWLYGELAGAMDRKEPVLIFAHHHPSDFAGDGAFGFVSGSEGFTGLVGMLKHFPNVIGYFYGHAHEKKVEIDEGVAFVQAPSLVDFPQGALVVQVFLEADNDRYRLQVDHVLPRASATSGAGLVLDGIVNESIIFAWADDGMPGPRIRIGEERNDGPNRGHVIYVDAMQRNVEIPSASMVIPSKVVRSRISDLREHFLQEHRGDWKLLD